MSNPIKSLLPTPLSMNFISDINALNQLPLPLFKFLIDSSLSIISTLNISHQSIFKNILLRQNINQSLIQPSLNSLQSIQTVLLKVLKLMKTSQPQQLQTNLQNCQKYLASVFSQNTLLQSTKISYFIEKLSLTVNKSLQLSAKTIETNLGTVQWSIYNLKKTHLNNSQQNLSTNNQQSVESTSQLKTINKMYVKVSFGPNFSPSQVQKLVQSGFQSNLDNTIEANFHQSPHQRSVIHQNISKTVVMSLIDFRVIFLVIKLLMEEMEKIKNLNY